MMRRLFLFTIPGLVLAAACLRTQAQNPPRYQPQRPTVSPYLNLLRNDTGPLPNYYSLVRPQLNQLAFDRQMMSESRLQSLTIQKLETVTEQRLTGPTGSGSVYGSLSHFYPSKQTNPQLRRR